MYGSEGGTLAASGTLASTGLAAGSWSLLVIAMLFAGGALLTLLRRKSAYRP
jgi:LPXTG-motif cell wall-anchored protein